MSSDVLQQIIDFITYILNLQNQIWNGFCLHLKVFSLTNHKNDRTITMTSPKLIQKCTEVLQQQIHSFQIEQTIYSQGICPNGGVGPANRKVTREN